MKKLLIVGASISQKPTIETAREMKIQTIVVDGSDKAPFIHLADKFYCVDIKDLNGVLNVAQKEKIDAIVVPGTDFPLTGAYVSRKMGLPGMPEDVARICSDKLLTRKTLKEAGFFTPSFIEVDSSSLHFSTKNLKYPLMVKPVDNMAARGIKKIYSSSELYDAIQKAEKFSHSGRVIVEEFVPGMEFSIDALVYNGEVFIFAFADRHFILDPYLIENGHTMPSILQNSIVEEVNKEFIKGVKALGIDNGAAKGDVKLTEHGIMIGEIAARISGGFLSGWTVPLAYDIFPHRSLIKIAFGEPPEDLTPRDNSFSAERVIMSIPGKIQKTIDHHDKTNLPLLHMHVHNGEEVCFPVNNALRCGSAISVHEERNQSIEIAKQAIKDVFIMLEPNNYETDSFLYGKDYFHEFKDFKMFEPGKKETDWHDMDLEEALYRVRFYTGKKNFICDKKFWKAFYKGGAQGGVYQIMSK